MDKLNADTQFQDEDHSSVFAADPAPTNRVGPLSVDRAQLLKIVAFTLVLMLIMGVLAFMFPEVLPGAMLAPLLACVVTIGIALALRQRLKLVTAQEHLIDTLRADIAKSHEAEELASFGTWEHDLDTEQLWFSPSALSLFGMAPGSVMPSLKGFLISVHPEDQVRWSEAHRRAMRQATDAKLEYRYKQVDGETIWVRSVAKSHRNSRGEVTHLTGVIQDVSAIRMMQKKLAASEAKFRDLTNLSSDWIWETDTDNRITYLSPSADAVLGPWAKSSLERKTWHYAKNDDALPTKWDIYKEAFKEKKPFDNFEFTLLDPNRSVYHISLSGRPLFDDKGQFTGFRGTGHNISQEKEQRMLLELDRDIATIMREQSDPERVITATIITLCGRLGWIGGFRLTRQSAGFATMERWGYAAFNATISDVPEVIPYSEADVESKVWERNSALWLGDPQQHLGFYNRYGLEKLKVKACFFSPIVDESGQTTSLLVFMSPNHYRDSRLLSEIGQVMTRSLSLYLQRKAAEKRLTFTSLHDALTSLPNRAYVNHQLGERLKKGKPISLLYIDLDRYKLINDTLGHAAGDKVLIEVAQRLRESIRPRDVAGRMGGDEFIILLPGLTDKVEIEKIARNVLTSIEKAFILQNRAYFLSASIGVAMAPNDAVEADLLIKAADAAMYQVKSEGRNDVRFFAGAMSDERTEQLQLAAELPLALQRGEIDLWYQPVLDVAQRRIVN